MNQKKGAGKRRLNKFGKLAFVVSLFPAGLYAQKIPPTEIYGAISDFRLKDCCEHVSLWGWQAGASSYIYKNLAATVDFGTQYKAVGDYTYKQYEFLFGPQVNIRRERFTGFGHVLFGAMHYNCGGLPACLSNTGPMLGFGGGIDVPTGSRIALRLPQIDWLATRLDGTWHANNLRIAIGVAYKLGAR